MISHHLAIHNEFLRVLRMNSRKYGEKILTATLSPFGIYIWKVFNHSRHLDARLIKCSHRDFIISRWVANLYSICFHQFLFTLQNLFQISGCDHLLRWQEVLAIRWMIMIKLVRLTVVPTYRNKKKLYRKMTLRNPRVRHFLVSSCLQFCLRSCLFLFKYQILFLIDVK